MRQGEYVNAARRMLTVPLVAVCAMALFVPGAGARVVAHPHAGELARFPAMRGVVPVLGSPAAVSARERMITGAFAHARAHGALQAGRGLAAPEPVPNEFPFPCANEEEELASLETLDVCYHGGPVLRDPTIKLIYWLGPVGLTGAPTTPGVEAFPTGFQTTVERYFEDVAHDHGLSSNAFAVDPQYGDAPTPGERVRGENNLAFAAGSDVAVSNLPFPKKCTDSTPFSKGPCVLDEDIQKEVASVATAQGWERETRKVIFVVLTAPGVGSCFEAASGECAFAQFCAYHGDFGGTGLDEPATQTLYADLPFLGGVEGCDSGVHPNSGEDNGADAVIDTASHEVNEAITDPIGSQCDEEAGELVGCEHGAWTDAIGQEIADKCLPPEVPVAGIYGPPLGGVNPQFYNQLINGDHYFTQREWSNEAGTFEGACVQRAIGASFTVSAAPAATVPTTFDGSPSGAPGDRAVYWVWNFEGEQIGTSSPATSHAFASAGEKRVTLTAFDAFGNAEATSQRVLIGPAPPPPPPPKREVETIFSTTTTTTATSLPAVERLTLAQLARALGLPAEGATLSGAGALSLGRATCPPACALTVQIFARTSTTKRGHRSSSNTLVGSAKVTIAAKSAKVVSVSLNARGKSLLRRLGKLKVSVKVAIEDAQGATWQLTRSLTIKGAAKGKRARR